MADPSNQMPIAGHTDIHISRPDLVPCCSFGQGVQVVRFCTPCPAQTCTGPCPNLHLLHLLHLLPKPAPAPPKPAPAQTCPRPNLHLPLPKPAPGVLANGRTMHAWLEFYSKHNPDTVHEGEGTTNGVHTCFSAHAQI